MLSFFRRGVLDEILNLIESVSGEFPSYSLVKETIQEVKQTYTVNYKDNNQETSGLEFSINDQFFLETLLLMIRGNTIKYSSFKKKQKQQEEEKLEQDIK